MSILEPPVPPRAAFADELWERLAGELERRPSRLRGRTFLVAAALLVALAGVATATYFGVRALASGAPPKPAQLTVVNGSTIVVLANGHSRVVWKCPRRVFCGDLTSVDWSRDGHRVAFTLDEIGGSSGYVGLHIVDLRTDSDLHLPRFALRDPLRKSQPMAILRAEFAAEVKQLGCAPVDGVEWSPNGRRLAYGCSTAGSVFTVDPDGRRRRAVPTGTKSTFAPSWSPDGSRLAFATGRYPTEVVAVRPTAVVHSALYVIGLDGRGRRLLAHDAASPDWSPAGNVIVYVGAHGDRLITPAGRDVTPRRGLPKGAARFSPDGSQLAIQGAHSLFVYAVGDWSHTRIRWPKGWGGDLFGAARPAWFPGERVPPVRSLQGGSRCAGCF